MRHLTGVGTTRSLQGRASALVEALIGLLSGCWGRVRRVWAPERHDRPDSSWDGRRHSNTDTRFSIDNQPLLPRAASFVSMFVATRCSTCFGSRMNALIPRYLFSGSVMT